IGTTTRRERQYISLSERGQALQLRLAMVYMYAEDVVRFRFQFVIPLHKLDKRIDARRRAAWALPDGAAQQVRQRDSCGCFRLGLAYSWPSWRSSEPFCLDDRHQEMHVSHTRRDNKPSPI